LIQPFPSTLDASFCFFHIAHSIPPCPRLMQPGHRPLSTTSLTLLFSLILLRSF
jgi:hypothetical protein